MSFWLMGIPVGIVLGFLTLLAEYFAAGARSPVSAFYAAPFLLAFAYIATVWQNVGIWRSAGRHIRERGKRFWAVAARIAVSIGSLSMVGGAVYDGATVWRAAIDAVRDFPAEPPSGVRILRDGAEIEISGPLRWSLVAQFHTALEQAPNARVVHLDSPGGLYGTALEIRDMIRERRLDSFVANQCASACTIAYLAGQRRWMLPNAQIGFHQPNIGGRTSLAADRHFRTSYREAGLPDDFIAKILAVPPTDN